MHRYGRMRNCAFGAAWPWPSCRKVQSLLSGASLECSNPLKYMQFNVRGQTMLSGQGPTMLSCTGSRPCPPTGMAVRPGRLDVRFTPGAWPPSVAEATLSRVPANG